MPDHPRLPLWAGRTVALIGILFVAFNLRTAVTALSPIADAISVDIPMDSYALAFLGMVPPIAFSVSGLIGAAGARMFGLERLLVIAIGAMAIGFAIRAAAGD